MESIDNTPITKINKKCKQFQIGLNKKNYERLKDLGRAGDSFNDVLDKILSKYPGVYSIDVKTEQE